MTATPVRMSEPAGETSKGLKKIARSIERKAKRKRKIRKKKVDMKFINGEGYIPLPKTYFTRNYDYNPYNESPFKSSIDKNVNIRFKHASSITKTTDLRVQGSSLGTAKLIKWQYDDINNNIDNFKIWKTADNDPKNCSQCIFWEEEYRMCKNMVPVIYNEEICKAWRPK